MNIDRAKLDARLAERDRLARHLAALHADGSYPPHLLAAHVAAAATLHHRPYPQYAGRWDDLNEWGIVRFIGPVRSKAGLLFDTGDVTVGRYEAGVMVAYSWRCAIEAHVGYSFVVVEDAAGRDKHRPRF